MPTFTTSLRGQAAFAKLFRRGNRSNAGEIRVFWSKNDRQNVRWGIVVSKKVSKKAVVRNRLRRQIREYLRHEVWEVPLDGIIQVVRLPLGERSHIVNLARALTRVQPPNQQSRVSSRV